jgi:hypothetical protein
VILAAGMMLVGLLLGFLGGVVAATVLDGPEQAQSPQTVTVERTVEVPAPEQANATPTATASPLRSQATVQRQGRALFRRRGGAGGPRVRRHRVPRRAGCAGGGGGGRSRPRRHGAVLHALLPANRRGGEERAALGNYLTPIFALFYGVILLGEPLTIAAVVGLALIIFGAEVTLRGDSARCVGGKAHGYRAHSPFH